MNAFQALTFRSLVMRLIARAHASSDETARTVNPIPFLRLTCRTRRAHLSCPVRFFRYLALLVFFMDLPVPVYWFILHPFAEFWRTRIRAAFYIAGLGAWIASGIFVFLFRHDLVAPGGPSIPIASLGITLIVVNGIVLYRATRDLGHMKLVGHAELSGKTDLVTTGLYRHIRHPRYAGMIVAIAGACIVAGTRWAFTVSTIWLVLVIVVIFLEEREMRTRFGTAYRDYCRAVPRFLPRV
jgi:protein-S-isoprenylcysteine O-methyltransferase Ste14